MIGPNGAGKTTLLSILAGIRDARRRRRSTAPRRDRLGAAAGGALPAPDRGREPAPVRAPRGASTTSRRRSSRCSARPGSTSGATIRSATLSGGNQQRVNIAIGLLVRAGGPAARRADRPASTRASASACGSSSSDLAGRGHDRDLLDPQHRRGRALRRPAARARRRRAPLRRHLGASFTRRSPSSGAGGDFEAAFVAFLQRSGDTELDALAARSRTCRSCGARR